MGLHIWDTGGAEKFRSIAPLYYRGAHAAILVYSITDETSFRGIDDWVKHLDEYASNANMIRVIVGNKKDVENNYRKVES